MSVPLGAGPLGKQRQRDPYGVTRPNVLVFGGGSRLSDLIADLHKYSGKQRKPQQVGLHKPTGLIPSLEPVQLDLRLFVNQIHKRQMEEGCDLWGAFLYLLRYIFG